MARIGNRSAMICSLGLESEGEGLILPQERRQVKVDVRIQTCSGWFYRFRFLK